MAGAVVRTIGLMSGTSLDGFDAVLAEFGGSQPGLTVLAHAHTAMPPSLREELLALNTAGDNELHRAALASNAVAQCQADLVNTLVAQWGGDRDSIRAIGSHGQTVRHRPGEFDGRGYTLQLNQGALLAELTGLDVICDFRSRDVAAGGQGAPLVPAFHAQVFGQSTVRRSILNLGGIANLTLLPPPGDACAAVLGFDCGPANALLDHWISQHQHLAYDANGAWSQGGVVQAELLDQLLREPFLAEPPPKSTGRDLFNPAWLNRQLAAWQAAAPTQAPRASPCDVQATLAQYTAASAAQALLRYAPATQELLVCGGGALNTDLMARLARALPTMTVTDTKAAGLPPLQVEAAAFAWLAWCFLNRRAGNLPAVTGARTPVVLGALYPA
jgi:anhydro-N-acetylmuramic acid kinase